MTVAVQTAFAAALQAAAGSVPVHALPAPQGAALPCVVYALIPAGGPEQRTYGGHYVEPDLYLVSCVAPTQLAAGLLAETVAAAVDGAALAGALTMRRENWAPSPPPVPDQLRFVRAFYVRVRHAH